MKKWSIPSQMMRVQKNPIIKFHFLIKLYKIGRKVRIQNCLLEKDRQILI